MTTNEWSPAVMAAAKAMYSRLRIVDRARYPKWKHLDIDSTDHYCIAAKLAVDAFHADAVADVQVPAPTTWTATSAQWNL